MGRIILVTGGVSSGKSEFAEEICMELESIKGKKVVYVATGIAFDDEMKQKKDKHIERRIGKNWETLEAYDEIAIKLKRDFEKCGIVILDCVTMLISNNLFHEDIEFDANDKSTLERKKKKILNEIDSIIEYVKSKDIDLILVTNEIGLGGVSMDKLTRRFMELAGDVNKLLAKASDEVHLVVSGIPVKIK